MSIHCVLLFVSLAAGCVCLSFGTFPTRLSYRSTVINAHNCCTAVHISTPFRQPYIYIHRDVHNPLRSAYRSHTHDVSALCVPFIAYIRRNSPDPFPGRMWMARGDRISVSLVLLVLLVWVSCVYLEFCRFLL